jgi:hypothetical protein
VTGNVSTVILLQTRYVTTKPRQGMAYCTANTTKGMCMVCVAATRAGQHATRAGQHVRLAQPSSNVMGTPWSDVYSCGQQPHATRSPAQQQCMRPCCVGLPAACAGLCTDVSVPME